MGMASPRAGAAFAGLEQASTQSQRQPQSRSRYLLGLCRGFGGASPGAPRAPQRGVSELCSSLPRSASRSHPPCRAVLCRAVVTPRRLGRQPLQPPVHALLDCRLRLLQISPEQQQQHRGRAPLPLPPAALPPARSASSRAAINYLGFLLPNF